MTMPRPAVIQDRELVVRALSAVRDAGADFADALIVAVAAAHNAPTVESFDADAVKCAGMTPIGPGSARPNSPRRVQLT
ncbi:MAG: hypothetical protein FWD59_05975 [Micrococcales bacterium]|nr:hypothetical protein [Micrococcales bacterium]